MEELIRFLLVAVVVSVLAPRLMGWLGIISKEKMNEYYKSIGAIPRNPRR